MPDPKSTGRATATHRPGAVRMDDYPLLAYGPADDPKVRVASNGKPVAEILAVRDQYPEMPQAGLAAWHGLTEEELTEVLRWEADPQRPGA
jgi:hypothetical protein